MQNITAGDGVQAWWNAGYTGQGVDVALIDTGVAPVPALSGNGKIVNGPDLSLESQNPNVQYLDTNGHGTFMAGIIGGNDGQPGGYRGVAPDSRILSVKVGDADGGVDVSQVIAAIDWVVQHRTDNGMNIRVINLSYGTDSSQPFMIDPLAYAVERAWKAGIVVVTAAGNTGRGSGLADPAYDPWVIAVGAADTMGTPSISDDQPASFSAGASGCGFLDCRAPDLLAPGVHVQGLRDPGSYVDQNNPSAALGDQYFRGSGTSEAAAYVTGAVALLLQEYPQLSPDQVKQMLKESSDPLSGFSKLWQGARRARPERAALRTRRRANARQLHLSSIGTGSLEASRGSNHLSMNGVVLQGEEDIFGLPFNSAEDGHARGGRLKLVGRHVERLPVVGQFLERQLVERLELVGQLVERKLVERLELERPLLVGQLVERLQLVGQLVERQARGAARAGAVRAGRETNGSERAGADVVAGEVGDRRPAPHQPAPRAERGCCARSARPCARPFARRAASGPSTGCSRSPARSCGRSRCAGPTFRRSGYTPILTWYWLALAFYLAEVLVVHLQFRKQAHTLSLTEIGLTLGLLLARPLRC